MLELNTNFSNQKHLLTSNHLSTDIPVMIEIVECILHTILYASDQFLKGVQGS